jgi:hypothetical protein
MHPVRTRLAHPLTFLGFYCPSSTELPLACPSNSFSRPSAQRCSLCPAGETCELKDGTYLFTSCLTGTWNLAGENECHACLLGNSCGANHERPVPCLDGFYNAKGWKCHLCPAGSECLRKDEEPQDCPTNTYSLKGEMFCNECPRNLFCPHPDKGPSPCPDGSTSCYRNGTSTIFISDRRELQAVGSFLPTGLSSTLCPEGFTCAGGAAPPLVCGTGFYSDVGASTCLACGDGFICPSSRLTDRHQCPAGTYSYQDVRCRQCEPGFKCVDGKASGKVACDPATGTREYSLGGAIACTACPTNTECLATTYMTCSEGWFYDTDDTCQPCNMGFYCVNSLQKACKTSEWTNFIGATFCLECPIDHKCPAKNTAPTPCDANEWATPLSATCTVCAAGNSCPPGQMVPCGHDEWNSATDRVCHKCPLGKKCNARASTTDCAATGEYSDVGDNIC